MVGGKQAEVVRAHTCVKGLGEGWQGTCGGCQPEQDMDEPLLHRGLGTEQDGGGH